MEIDKSSLCRHSNMLLRKCLFAAVCYLCSFFSHAQKNKLDSLNQLISKAATDTARINLNLKKIDILGRSNLDTAIALCLQQLKLAEKQNYYAGVIALYIKLSNNYTFKGNYTAAAGNIAFLEKYIKPDDSLHIAGLYGAYGMMYGVQAKYDSSIKFYTKAISINEKLNNKNDLRGNYANLAIGYQQLANFAKALEYQQRALKLAEDEKDLQLVAKTLLNMGNTYENIADSLKAEQYYLKAGALAEKNGFAIVQLYVYTNLATMYVRESHWEKAYYYAMKAAGMGGAVGDIGIQGASLAKAAVALANEKKFDEAATLAKRSITLADSSTQPLNIAQAYNAMGATLHLQKKYAEAIPYYEKGIGALDGASNYDQAFVLNYKDLSECYEKNGNYVKALSNYKVAAEIQDSIKRKDNIRKVTMLSMNYDFEKKQQEQALEKKKEDEITKTKQLALIIGMALTFVLALVALNGYRNKQKANALLSGQKQQIENTLSELKSTQTQLIQSEKMASLGELTAGIAHEIQNPLNFVNNFSELNKELLEELRGEADKGNIDEVKAIATNVINNEQKISHHGKRAEAIVKGMLQHSRQTSGTKEPTDINALADEYLRLSYQGLRAKDKSFNADFTTAFDENIGKINIVPQDMGRMLLNLYNNAFYAVAEKKKQIAGNLAGFSNLSDQERYVPAVTVVTKKLNDKIEIHVLDNGNGIPQSVIDKIFQPFFTTKPTGQGTGLGLSLSYDIIIAHGGEIKVETKEGEGTEFIIQLPVN
ncbi:hypothetical protein BH10BAC2_BH10BAC2_39110 [soil metagenome]